MAYYSDGLYSDGLCINGLYSDDEAVRQAEHRAEAAERPWRALHRRLYIVMTLC